MNPPAFMCNACGATYPSWLEQGFALGAECVDLRETNGHKQCGGKLIVLDSSTRDTLLNNRFNKRGGT